MRKRETKIKTRVCALVLAVLLTLFGATACSKPESNKRTIRIGWQTAWATQGQIVQTLKHTNILEKNGMNAEFVGFSYGGPLNEAAKAGKVDVGFAADQPTANLIASGGKFKIVCRLMDFRSGIIVPNGSSIKQISDLKGKTLAIPFGSTAHRLVLNILRDAGLDPDKDVKIINLDIAEQASVVQAGDGTEWNGDIDALVSWDPNIEIFLNKGQARILQDNMGLAVMYMSEDFINNHREEAINFVKSYIEGYYYYTQNKSNANKWFADEARIKFDPSLLDIVASFEKNTEAKNLSDINVKLSDKDIKAMEDGAEFGFAMKMSTVKPDMKNAVNNEIVEEAIKRIGKETFDINSIKEK